MHESAQAIVAFSARSGSAGLPSYGDCMQLLLCRNHLPRSAPPPECVHKARALQRQLDMPQDPKPTNNAVSR